MKIVIAITLFIASLSTIVMLFLGTTSKSSAIKVTPATSINIKWGEGSEVVFSDSTTRN